MITERGDHDCRGVVLLSVALSVGFYVVRNEGDDEAHPE